jgi:hypothetical protein
MNAMNGLLARCKAMGVLGIHGIHGILGIPEW